jgi:hypothetical protein
MRVEGLGLFDTFLSGDRYDGAPRHDAASSERKYGLYLRWWLLQQCPRHGECSGRPQSRPTLAQIDETSRHVGSGVVEFGND